MPYTVEFDPETKKILSEIRDALKQHIANQNTQLEMIREDRRKAEEFFKNQSGGRRA